MKVLIQRVSQASVAVDAAPTGQIGRGLVVFVGVKEDDCPRDAGTLAYKTANLRIFPDEQDRMNLSLLDIDGEALVISQFTLYADTRKGHRPSFVQAAPPTEAEALYDHYVQQLATLLSPDKVKTGRFRASMQVALVNDGPVTISIES